MIDVYPTMDDGYGFYLFLPMQATLYGRDAYPYRFLRVIDSNDVNGQVRVTNALTLYDGDPEGSCIVETVDDKTFVEFISFGYTPYIECAFSGFNSNFDLSNAADFIFTEAALRNYEGRARALMSLCQRKKYSLLAKSTASTVTSELVDEMLGVLTLWEMLMNHGRIQAGNCLESMPGKRHFATIPLKTFQKKFDVLEDRLLMSNYKAMRYKLSEGERQAFKDSIG